MTKAVYYDYSQRFHRYRSWVDYSAVYNGPEISGSTVNGINFSSYDHGARLDNWKYLVRHHSNATSTRYAIRRRYRGGDGFHETTGYFYANLALPRVKGYTNCYGRVIWVDAPSTGTDTGVANQTALRKFYKSIASARSAFQGGVFLGELTETLHMLRNPAKALRKGLDNYLSAVKKRGRGKRGNPLRKTIADTWLEHVFGWRPLISDVKSAGDALNRRLERYQGNFSRIYGKGEEDQFIEQNIYSSNPTEGRNARTWYRRDFINRKVKYYGELRSKATPVLADADLLGLSWEDTLPTVWELIPYSFLVDYFVNIGEVIQSWSLQNVDLAWAGKSSKVTAIRRGILRTHSVHSTNVYTNSMPKTSICACEPAECIYEYIQRGATGLPDPPSLAFQIPGMSTRWINMSALLASRNKTRRSLRI